MLATCLESRSMALPYQGGRKFLQKDTLLWLFLCPYKPSQTSPVHRLNMRIVSWDSDSSRAFQVRQQGTSQLRERNTWRSAVRKPMGVIPIMTSGCASEQLYLALRDLMNMTPCSRNCNNASERYLRNRLLQQGLHQKGMLKISLLAKMTGEGRKCSSLWPGTQGTAKYHTRSHWHRPCGPWVELTCPHLRAKYHQHHAVTATQTFCLCWERARRERFLWLHRETLSGDEEPHWKTPWHLQKDRTPLLNGWSKPTKHPKYKHTSKGVPWTLPSENGMLWEQYQKFIWSSPIWEHGLVMERLHH